MAARLCRTAQRHVAEVDTLSLEDCSAASLSSHRSFTMEYLVTQWLWLLPPFIAAAIWVFRDRRERENDLGSVSAQWLHEYRRETHQDR